MMLCVYTYVDCGLMRNSVQKFARIRRMKEVSVLTHEWRITLMRIYVDLDRSTDGDFCERKSVWFL